MTAFTALTLANYAAVAKTFSQVRKTENGTAIYAERSSGVPVLYPEVRIQLMAPPDISPKDKMGNVDNKLWKAMVKVAVPVADITAPASGTGIQPAPSKAYEVRFNLTIDMPARSDLVTRRDAFAYFKALLAKTEITNLVENQEGIY